jgi:hypothetical protein
MVLIKAINILLLYQYQKIDSRFLIQLSKIYYQTNNSILNAILKFNTTLSK